MKIFELSPSRYYEALDIYQSLMHASKGTVVQEFDIMCGLQFDTHTCGDVFRFHVMDHRALVVACLKYGW